MEVRGGGEWKVAHTTSPLLPTACFSLTPLPRHSLPTPIQAEAVPLILGGGDVLAAAETGSGKTGAFALPLLQLVGEARAGVASTRRASPPSAPDTDPTAPTTVSPVDRDPALAVSAEGDRAQARSAAAWCGARATHGVSTGCAFCEATVQDGGLVRVGWATATASLELGTDGVSVGYGGTGKASHGGSFKDYGRPFSAGAVVGCAVDADAGTASFLLDGAPLGDAATIAIPPRLPGDAGALFPALCLKNAEVKLNFGGTPFVHPPPPGFPPLDTATGRVPAAAARAALPQKQAEEKTSGRPPLALVLEPSKDLAEQTAAALTALAARLPPPGVSVLLLVGGDPAAHVRAALTAGADVVVGTLGRVGAAAAAGDLSLASIRLFVLDEADRLLDPSGADEVASLFGRLPRGGAGAARLQVLLFSATLDSPDVARGAARLCAHPTHIDLKGPGYVPAGVDHVRVDIDPIADRSWMQAEPRVPDDSVHAGLPPAPPGSETPEHLSLAVKKLKPRLLLRLADALAMDQCVVFCRTNHDCDQLEAFLRKASGAAATAPPTRGPSETGAQGAYTCVVLAGARSTEDRREALRAFKAGEARFLICTDVGARGIDVDGLPYCVNLALPDTDHAEDYVHRVGRVGRAGRRGLAISLVATVKEKVWYCTRKGHKPWLAPTADDQRVIEEGGHTMWRDERACLAAVQTRLGAGVRALPPDLSLPADIAAAAAAGAGGGGYGGDAATAEADAALKARLTALAPAVAELARLEADAQASFFELQRRWVV